MESRQLPITLAAGESLPAREQWGRPANAETARQLHIRGVGAQLVRGQNRRAGWPSKWRTW